MNTTALDAFGSLITQHLRDAALRRAEAILCGSLTSPATQALQSEVQSFSPQQCETLRSVVRASVDAGIHDFLFKLQEFSSLGSTVKVLVNGQDIASLSDGLHGEAYSNRGWYSRFSAFPSEDNKIR